MEPLKQFLKIGAALAALVVIGLAVIPERPTLLSGGAGTRAQAPIEAMQETIAQVEDGPEPESAAPAPDASEQATAAEVEAAEAPPAAQAQADEPALTPGQLHLQRLRGEAPGATAPDPAAEPPAEDEFAAPAEMPPEMDPAAPVEDQGGGAGIASLTQPAAPVQFRLLSAPNAADSGTISAGGQSVRLAGVVPVPAEARCADGTSCGAAARDAVQSWLAGRALLCAISPEAGGSTEAPCLMGEEDVGEWIVGNGWAEAAPGSRYVEAQERARADGRGIWAAGGR